jgi:anti-anti-sigma regulatory factor
MEITTQLERDVATLRLSGRFDFTAGRAFRRECGRWLAMPHVAAVEIDLAGVHTHDATVPGLLLVLRENAYVAGKRLCLRNAPPAIDATLALTASCG